MSFAVLFVCTGNICRSPIAERVFSARIDPHRAVSASSAGTAGMTGYPMDDLAAQVLRELGGDSAGHVARRLSQKLIAESDLILTGETSHRSQVILADPMAFRRVFTLREFGRLGAELQSLPAEVTEEQLRTRVLEVAAQRGLAAMPEERSDDIADPYGAPVRVMRTCGQQITDAVDAALGALGLASVSRTALRTCEDQ